MFFVFLCTFSILYNADGKKSQPEVDFERNQHVILTLNDLSNYHKVANHVQNTMYTYIDKVNEHAKLATQELSIPVQSSRPLLLLFLFW